MVNPEESINIPTHSEADFELELLTQMQLLGFKEDTADFDQLPQQLQYNIAKRTALEVRKALTKDPMTGLESKYGMELALRREVLTSKRSGQSFAVFLCDGNFFKSINEETQEKHQAGDKAIKAIGKGFKESTRASDVAGRVGGDEFMLILRGIDDPLLAHAVAQKIITQVSIISNQAFPTVRQELHRELTLSGGVAIYNPRDNLSINEILEQADGAATEAKKTYLTKGNVVGIAKYDSNKGWSHLVPPTDLSPNLS